MEVPLEFKANFFGDEVIDRDDAPDCIQKFLDTVHLSDGLAAEVAELDNHVRKVYAARAKAAAVAKTATGWDEQISDATTRLAKRARTDTRFEKSQNGKWLYELDSRGELVSGHEIQ